MKATNTKFAKKSIFILTVIVIIACVVVLNISVVIVTDRLVLQKDLTASNIFTLSAEATEALKKLTKQVKIEVLAREETFVNTSTYNAQANEIIKQIAKASPNVDLEYIDYVKNPGYTSKYPSLTIKQGDIMVLSDRANHLIKTEDLFNYVSGQGGNPAIGSSKAEEAVISGILNVTAQTKPIVSVISGHSEYTMPSFEALLTKNNYEVVTNNLLIEGINKNALFALLIAPKTDLSPQELEALDAFLTNGGNFGKTLVYFADSATPSTPNLDTFLAEWGIEVGNGTVFETDENKVYNYQPFYAVAEYVDFKYSDMLRSADLPLLMPMSRPLSTPFAVKANYTTTTLAQFSKSSGVRPIDAPESFTAKDAEVLGPIPALVLTSYVNGNDPTASTYSTSNVLVSGSTATIDAFAIDNASFANSEYFINIFNDIANRKDVIKITPKTITGQALNLTATQVDAIGSIFIFVIPAVILALGIFVWMRRRHS